LCAGQSGPLDLRARVCNRGTAPVTDGVAVAFFARPNSDPSADGSKLCETSTPKLLGVGECTEVSCRAELPADHDVFVVVDPEGKIADCHPGNSDAAGTRVVCATVR
jgi:hypothetical protein